ncbi:MAG: bacillithiol biosynthesis cysteine-adding enzyme BshC, partial [Flavobacteriaceae bacterium]
EVDKKDLFLTRKALTDKKVVQISAIDLSLHPLKKQLTEQFNFLENLVSQTDASFEGAVRAQKQKQFKGIDRLEKRLLKAQRRKLNNQVERLTLVQESIFPNNSLQERYANFFEFYLEYGEDLLPQIMESLEPLQLEFSWIELS